MGEVVHAFDGFLVVRAERGFLGLQRSLEER
jgi:hypothetical protein